MHLGAFQTKSLESYYSSTTVAFILMMLKGRKISFITETQAGSLVLFVFLSPNIFSHLMLKKRLLGKCTTFSFLSRGDYFRASTVYLVLV